jgi:hypothetical protein
VPPPRTDTHALITTRTSWVTVSGVSKNISPFFAFPMRFYKSGPINLSLRIPLEIQIPDNFSASLFYCIEITL